MSPGLWSLVWKNLGVLFRFGEFQLDDQRLTLAGPEGSIHLEPQVFGVLHYLIRNRDRVVSKEELFDGVWGNRFVSDSALTSRVKAARRAVGDDGQVQRVIQTVHGRGYRFVAEVRVASPDSHRDLAPLRHRLIGRSEDIKGVIELVRDAALVTVTGPGGMGKTTLALAVAHQLQPEFIDGVVFVDLAPVPPDADVTRAVADAAGLEGQPSRSVESVADHLAARPVLLVLDNCEHVLGRTAELVHRMLGRGGAARILTTSREPLRVVGEHVWPLGPLVDTGPHLFVERARAADPRVLWVPGDPAVVELCRRLDNLPLALELAAGQLRRFDLAELSARLESRLTLLSQRAVGDSQRHATMEATIAWSYQLLDPTEQRLLRELSVFPASFDLAAVEASASPLPDSTIADVLGELVDKSLVVRQPGAPRYRLLETIRVFARDHLDRAGETEAAFERHRRSVRRRVGSASRLDRWFSARLAAEFRRDLGNARQAFRLSVDGGHPDDAIEIATGASFLWRNSLGCTEGDEWVKDLLKLELSRPDRLWVHLLGADVGIGRGDYRQMAEAAASAQRLVGAAGDPISAGLAAIYLVLVHLTDPGQAQQHLAAALERAEAAADPRLVALAKAFHNVTTIAAGERDRAREALSVLEQETSADGYDRFITHWAGWILGLVERDATATRRWMTIQEEFLDRTGIVETWLSAFSSALSRVVEGGEVSELLARPLALADREGYRAEADCVLVLAYAELCAGRFEAAAELMGTAVHDRFNTTGHYVFYRVVLESEVRRQLPAQVFSDAMARGRRRDAAEVLADYGVAQ